MRGEGQLLTGAILGAGAMYLLDPDRGARRRSLLRDQGTRAGRKLNEGLETTLRDARNRARGAAAEARSRFRGEEADDEVLHERVRSAIGRVVSHPHAITVIANQGRIILGGHVLADELDDLIARVGRVRGVRQVENELTVHPSAEGVPDLQGGRTRQQRSELWQENWSPATRLIVGSVGGILAVEGIRSRNVLGNGAGLIGLGLLVRAMTNLPASRLVGIGAGPRAIDIQKTIRVHAPVERVWELWSNFENFPRFMSHLREVRDQGENRSHWVAVGPAGIPVSWDATITELVPNELVAWRSVEGSAVDTEGRVRFRPVDGVTEIDVRLWYNPPAGATGHLVASMFGTDPKHAMDEDLVRLKSLLEEGKTSANGDQIRLEEVGLKP